MGTALNGKIAVVTGGARGIGLATCEALAASGCKVAVADINREEGAAAAQQLCKCGQVGRAYDIDVTDQTSVRDLFSRVVQDFGRVDILVNSSGVAPNVIPTIRLELTEWTRVLQVNLYGTFLCCREAGLLMAKQEGGRIINIASLNSVSPAALTAAYNVSKAGVVSLTQTLAIELAPFKVNVNAVSPGPIETKFHDVVMPQRAATLGIERAAMFERVRASIPLGRWGVPSDVAKTVVFLASSESDWMTGQNLIVAGGLAGVNAAPAKEVILGKD
jgi:NAD(P)-dependent dehydrogenase (short-subunit alcohol dehydrogenase family)